MDVSSTNIANVNTNTTPEGGPYKAKTVQFSENLMAQQADLNDPSSSLNSPVTALKLRASLLIKILNVHMIQPIPMLMRTGMSRNQMSIWLMKWSK